MTRAYVAVTTWLSTLSPAARGAVAVAAIACALAATSDVAEARVGGGQGFSGGRSSGGGGGGGGGGGDLGDILFLLLHLAIYYPAIGIPLLILFIGAVLVRVLFFSGNSRSRPDVFDPEDGDGPRRPTARAPAEIPGLKKLREADPAFSVPVFLDYAGLVHRRAVEAASESNWGPLQPFVAEGVKEQVATQFEGRAIRDVIVGATVLERITWNARVGATARVLFESNYTLDDASGTARHILARTAWTFRRGPNAVSLAPEATLALNCPNCGSPVDTNAMGACKSCDTPITKGQLQWQATAFTLTHSELVKAPELGPSSGGDEPSVSVPTITQPALGVALRKFQGRHPDFDKKAFHGRVEAVFLDLQAAWSGNEWEKARAFVTDPLYQQLRFWIERYKRNGLRNQLTDVALESSRIVKVDQDAWYDAITVRIVGSMKDVTVDESGRVVAGNARQARRFSEYWTFLRASGTGAASPPPNQCPSCGAPLDRVGSTGVCGYCDAKITSGRFDWILSRIEQPESYRG